MKGYFAAVFMVCNLWSDYRNQLYLITKNNASVPGGLQTCNVSSAEMSPLCILYSPLPYEFKQYRGCHVGSWRHTVLDESSEVIL